MEQNQTDDICALCKWSRNVDHNYFCGHPGQQDESMKKKIYYNDSCELFEEREDRKSIYE